MIAHWDEVEGRLLETGPMRLTRVDLGDAIGSDRIGVGLLKIQPGGRSSPVHCELAEEEIFYVLRGSGVLWQDEQTHEVGSDDCIVHVAEEQFHTLVAGPDGLDVLAFGQRVWVTATYLPRAGVARMAVTIDVSTGPHPWEREAAAGELELPNPSPRPPNVVALADAETVFGGTVSLLGKSCGSVRTGLNHVTLSPGGTGAPPHCHSAEEEIFLVLDGSGALQLGDEEHPVRAGHAISRRPGTGIAHSFVAGDSGMKYLAYGTREPNDITYYPETGQVRLRGVGVTLETR
jgi:uncharacterized cupin superfamily protein